MFMFTYLDDICDTHVVAVSKSKTALFQFAKRYIGRMEARPTKDFKLTTDGCDEKEYAIMDSNDDVVGWIHSGIREVAAPESKRAFNAPR